MVKQETEKAFLVINLVPTSVLSHLLKVSTQIAFLHSLPIFFM